MVGYHKPATLIKSEIFEPIHLGRALATECSKDGSMSQDDYQWMLDNMIGDDTGDNISVQNRRLCEITALYWAWKNYDKLGNPDYIGFCHYRRFLNFSDHLLPEDTYGLVHFEYLNNDAMKKMSLDDNTIKKCVKNYDIVTVTKFDVSYKSKNIKNIRDQYNSAEYLHVEDYDTVIEFIKKRYPNFKRAISIYNNSKEGYFTNIFIMRKDIFFDYCNWLFNILKEANIRVPNYNNFEENRALGHISERLLGIYLTYLKLTNAEIKIKELQRTLINNTNIIPTIKPSMQNEIPIVMSVDDGYIPYLSVTLQSILDHISTDNFYTIYILYTQINKISKNKILKMQKNNCLIKFVDIKSCFSEINSSNFYCGNLSITTYFRIFIPEIFKNFEKVIYCDCDAIYLEDPAKLYQIDINNYLMGVASDIELIRQIYINEFGAHNYYKNILKLRNPYNYFQAGLLLMNIQELLKFDFCNICLNYIEKIKKPRYADQDILNIVCEDKVKYIDTRWNVENHILIFNENIDYMLPHDILQTYMNALKNPYFLHFSGSIKPWHNPASLNAELFWQYARKTPFYEEIIYRNTKSNNIVNTIAQFYSNEWQRIFSIRNLNANGKTFKVFTIFGIKIKIRKGIK